MSLSDKLLDENGREISTPPSEQKVRQVSASRNVNLFSHAASDKASEYDYCLVLPAKNGVLDEKRGR